MHSEPPSLQIHTFFNSLGSALRPGPHIRLPKALLNGSSFSFTGEKYAFWRVRVVLHPKTAGVIYLLPPYKMQSPSLSCSLYIIHSLGMTTLLRHYPKIIPTEEYCREGDANEMLRHTAMRCKRAPFQHRRLQNISPKQLGPHLHHELGFLVVCTQTPLIIGKKEQKQYRMRSRCNNKFLSRSKLILYGNTCDWSAPP